MKKHKINYPSKIQNKILSFCTQSEILTGTAVNECVYCCNGPGTGFYKDLSKRIKYLLTLCVYMNIKLKP